MRRMMKALSLTLAFAMLMALIVPGSFAAPAGISIEPVADMEARIVVASESGGVNWGNEPLIITLRVDPAGTPLNVEVSPAGLLDASLGGVDKNILTLTPKGETGVAKVTVTASADGAAASADFKVTINKYEDTGGYVWDTLQIPGGGFVTGFVFHPAVPDILYARTDVGGAWRYDFDAGKWVCISNWVRDGISGSPAQQLGLAVDPDPSRAGWVYLAYGSGGTIARSKDFGQTWVILGNSGAGSGGNSDGRGLGEKLIVMPGDGKTLFACGTSGGLRKSTDGGLTWSGITLAHGTGLNPDRNETVIGFVNYDPAHPDFIIASTAGAYGNPYGSDRLRGASVFYSVDGGATFKELPYQPEVPTATPDTTTWYGYVGYRSAFSKPDAEGNRYMFITYSDPRPNPGWQSMSTIGMEGQGNDGCLFRWKLDKNGNVLDWANITPVRITNTYIKATETAPETFRQFGVGMGGVSLDPQIPGAMVCSTHNSDFNDMDPLKYTRNQDTIYRSLDYGETWFPVNCGYNMYGNLAFEEKSPYSRPLVNGALNNSDGAVARWEPWTNIHWNTCPTINPFDSNMMVYNTGIGAYCTFNLTALDGVNKAEPHAASPYGDARKGLFKSQGGAVQDVVSSRYEAYKIGNTLNGLTAGQSVKWEAMLGLEMTVSMANGLMSPTSGDVIALNTLGDYGGFAFTSLTELPSQAYAFEREIEPGVYFPTDRWITGRNVDFAPLNPDVMVATVSGSWHWNSRGGVAITLNGAKSWNSIPDGWPEGAGRPEYKNLGIGAGMPTETLQGVVNGFKTSANSTTGYVVVNADASTILWSLGSLATSRHVYTNDLGQTWNACAYYNAEGNPVTTGNAIPIADKVDPNLIYSFANATLYVSVDGGKIFRQAITNYNGMNTNSIASINGSRELRADLSAAGTLYVGGNGLWKLTYDMETNTMSATQVPSINSVSRQGPGIGLNGVLSQALYVYGNKTGTGQQSGYGIWRSLDGGGSWTKLTYSTDNPTTAGTEADPHLNANRQFSDVRSVVGDSRVFGRVYLSCGNTPFSTVYGEMVTRLIEAGEEKPYLDEVTVRPAKIVETLAAYLPITASGGLLEGRKVFAALTDGETDFVAYELKDLSARMYVPAAPAAGRYCIAAWVEGYEQDRVYAPIEIVAYDPQALWNPDVTRDGGSLIVAFGGKIGGGITVESGAKAYAFTVDENILTVQDFDQPVGAKVSIRGIKYPELFPSYKFTFTVTA